jgi:carboxylate/amino acid/amine transporter
MSRLFIANLIWAFSFSLIGHYVSGKVDIYLSIFLRLFIGLLIWLPFLRFKSVYKKDALICVAVGALQIGCMYLAYYKSFSLLKVNEVALFTATTPLYITFFGNLLARKFSWISILAGLVATLGACVIRWSELSENFIQGFLLVQLANICFALGQVCYRKYISEETKESEQKSFFAFFYIGALLPVMPLLISRINNLSLEMPQSTALTLLWLGVMASGVSYFLWSSGSKKVSIGELAVMNNVLIPMAILANVIIWSPEMNWQKFIFGSIIIVGALYIEKVFVKLKARN